MKSSSAATESMALPPVAKTFTPSSTAIGREITIALGMKTPLAHDMMEQPVADQLGREKTLLSIMKPLRSKAVIHRRSDAGRGTGQWLLIMLIVALCGIVGCGPGATSKPVVKPHELSTDAKRLSVVRFSSDGKLLAAGSVKGEVFVWHESIERPIQLDSGRSSPFVSLTWSPDGLLCLTDLEHGFVGWQLSTAKREQVKPDRVKFPSLASAAVCVAFRPKSSERELVLGMQDGSLIIVNKTGSKQLKPEHRGPVKQALYSLDGKWLVTAGADGNLLWRDAATRQLTQTVKAAESDISRLLLSTDGQQLVSGDWNGRLKIWDMAARKSLREFDQPEAVSGLGWVGRELISGSWDGTLRGWDVSSGRGLRSLVTGQPIHDLATDSGTSRVATVSLDGSVRVWDWQAATSP